MFGFLSGDAVLLDFESKQALGFCLFCSEALGFCLSSGKAFGLEALGV